MKLQSGDCGTGKTAEPGQHLEGFTDGIERPEMLLLQRCSQGTAELE